MSSKLDAVQKVAVRACRKISGRKWMQEGEENRANADNINNKEPITGRRGTGSEYTCLSLQRSVLKACVRAAQLLAFALSVRCPIIHLRRADEARRTRRKSGRDSPTRDH